MLRKPVPRIRRALRPTTVAVSALAGSSLGLPPAATGQQPAQATAVVALDVAAPRRIAYGRTMRLRGDVSPAASATVVALEYAAAGRPFDRIAETTPDSSGSFAFSVRPRWSGVFRAVAETGERSDGKAVVVRPRLRAAVGRAHVLRRRPARVRGTLAPGRHGRPVVLEAATARGWRTIRRARTKASGRFTLRWRPAALGSLRLRVRFGGDRRNASARRRIGSVKVYRRSRASWYGPGFYSRRTACGHILRPTTVGVAHRKLRCGTRVTFRYRRRSVTVPVIDRGPYANGADWDLTAAAKSALRFAGVRIVWSTR